MCSVVSSVKKVLLVFYCVDVESFVCFSERFKFYDHYGRPHSDMIHALLGDDAKVRKNDAVLFVATLFPSRHSYTHSGWLGGFCIVGTHLTDRP